MKSKISLDEIFFRKKYEIKFAINICEANISYALAYFIAKRFHSPKANFIEKATLFLVRVTGLDGLCPSFATRTPDCVRLRRGQVQVQLFHT